MEHFRHLLITSLSATDLEDIRFMGKMKVYAIVSVTGGPPTEQYISEFTTSVDMEGETNPKWDTRIDFTLHDPSLQNNLLYLDFNFYCSRTFLRNKPFGSVSVPVKHLFDMFSANRTASQAIQYPVMKSSGGKQGLAHFCFKFEVPNQPSPQQPRRPYTPQPRVVSKTRQAKQVSGNSQYPYGSRSEQSVPNQANYSNGTAPANYQHNYEQQPRLPYAPQSQIVLGTVEQVSENIPDPSRSTSEQPVPNQARSTSEQSVPNQAGNTSEQPVSSEQLVPNHVGSTNEQPVPNQANYFSGTAPANDQHNCDGDVDQDEDQHLGEGEDDDEYA